MDTNKMIEEWRARALQAREEGEVDEAAALEKCASDLEHAAARDDKPDRYNLLTFVDVETGGFDDRECAILSIGVARVEPVTLEVIEANEVLVQPIGHNDKRIEEQAAKINGYDPERWRREGFHPVDAIREFRGWMRGFPVWWGSNPNFDFRFLSELHRDHSERMPELWTHHLQDVGSYCWPLIDAGLATGSSVSKLAASLGLGKQEHGAKADVLLSVEIVRKARKLIRCDYTEAILNELGIR